MPLSLSLSWAQALPDEVSKRNINFMDGESKPGLAMTANIYTIIAAIAQLAAITVGLRRQAQTIASNIPMMTLILDRAADPWGD